MIKHLTASNLNGRNFAYALAPLQIFTGNNARGKSTILDALKLATLGGVPGTASTAPAVMENYGTGPSLTVAISTAKGDFSRAWTRTGKTVKASTMGDEAVVEGLVPAMVNGELFFAAKAPQRANMLRAAFPSVEDPKEAVRLEVLNAFGPKDSADIADKPFDEWVDAYLEEIAEGAKGHRANVKRMKGVIQGLAQLDADALSSTVTNEQVEAARAELANKTRLAGAAQQAYDVIVVPEEPTKPSRTVEALTAEFERLTRDRTSKATTLQQGLDGYQRAVHAHNAYLDALQAHTEAATALEEATEKAADAGVDARNYAQIIEETANLRAQFEEQAEKVRLARQLAQQLKGRAEVAQAEYDTLWSQSGDGAPCCATCGAAREFWKAEIAEAAARRLQAAIDANNAAAEKAVNAEEQMIAESNKLGELEKLMVKRSAALALNETWTALGEHPKPEVELAPLTEWDGEALETSVYELDCELGEIREDLAIWSLFDTYQQHAENKVAAGHILNKAKAEETTAQLEVDKLAKSYAAATAARETQSKQEAAATELATAETKLDEYEAAAEAVKKAAAKEAEKVLEPLLFVVNQFTQGILNPPLSNVGLNIGRWHNATHWQPLGRLSGAEKAMVVAALSAALAVEGNKIVVLDEFSVIDDEWKPKFLANLREAKEAGQIQQAVILDNRPVTAEGYETTALQ